MPDDGVGANLPFAHQEIDLGRRTNCTQRGGFEKEPSEAEIAHPRNVVASITMPANPNILRRLKARIESPGWHGPCWLHSTHSDNKPFRAQLQPISRYETRNQDKSVPGPASELRNQELGERCGHTNCSG